MSEHQTILPALAMLAGGAIFADPAPAATAVMPAATATARTANVYLSTLSSLVAVKATRNMVDPEKRIGRLQFEASGGVGTGRRGGLKSRCPSGACGFDSHPPHVHRLRER